MSGLPGWAMSDVESQVATGGPILIDLRADWCQQCGPQEKVLERVAEEHPDIKFASLDVGVEPAFADKYEIRTLPAILVFNAGELQTTLIGFKRAPLVRDAIERFARSG